MKILIPILGFGKAGGYRVLSELANAWIRIGCDVSFIVPDSSDKPYFPTCAQILWVNNSGHISTCSNVAAKAGWKYHLQALYKGINRFGSNYNIILANHSLTAWPVALARCGKAKKIYYIQAFEPEYYKNKGSIQGYLLALFAAFSYHLPLKRIANAQIYLRYRNLRAIDYVPPGIDLSIFRPEAGTKAKENGGKIVVGCVGRREPEKGIIYVLRAFEKLNNKDKRFHLRVAYGNLPSDYCNYNCEIVIPQNDHELADFYRSLDILIAPGTVQHGAAHYPVMEALACGIPVVTTGYLGASESTAWLTKNRDVDSILKAIDLIVSDPEISRKKAENGVRMMAGYDWPRVAESFLKHFGQMGPKHKNI